jgi:peptidoglycan/LPS O-acetylase OafA/YrhL
MTNFILQFLKMRSFDKSKVSSIFLWCVFYAYAIIRYHFGKSLWEPLDYYFVINKTFAWLGGTLLMTTLIPANLLMKYHFNKSSLGKMGLLSAMLHIVSSIILLAPGYYPTMYVGDQLGIYGWLIIVLGGLGFLIYSLPLLEGFRKNKHSFPWMVFAGIFNLLHTFFLGFQNWYKPEKWPYKMLPITLIFVLTGLVFMYLRFFRQQKS